MQQQGRVRVFGWTNASSLDIFPLDIFISTGLAKGFFDKEPGGLDAAARHVIANVLAGLVSGGTSSGL